jgi:hypothetical protein
MDIIEAQYTQATSLLNYLREQGELSHFSFAETNLTKNFLLQCSSFHENTILSLLREFSEKNSLDNKLAEFIRNYVLDGRQYFKLIGVGKNNNLNKFLSLFGTEFKESFIEESTSNSLLDEGIKGFIEMFRLRGLIHKNLAIYSLENTLKDIYEIHRKAKYFIDYLRKKLLA